MPKRFTEEQNSQWQASLPKKKVAVKVIIKSNTGNILLVKPGYKDTWQLPGGVVESNEDPKAAAMREAKEEVGVDIKINDLQLLDCIFKPGEDFLFLLFESKDRYSERADYSVEDKEITEYKFVAPKDVAMLLPTYYKDFCKSYL